MKNRKNPNFLVAPEEFAELRDHKSRLFKTRLTKSCLDFLPKALQINELTLVFPMQLCPQHITFRTKDKQSCQRDILNITAHKEENGDEILKIRLK